MALWPNYKALSVTKSAELERLREELSEANTERDQRSALAQKFAVEAEELRQELGTERARRIAAETIAEERKSQIAELRASLEKAEYSRDSAVTAHLASLQSSRPVEPTTPMKMDKDQIARMVNLAKTRKSPMRLMEERDRNILMTGKFGKPAVAEEQAS